jgi:hypothetical protein
MKTILRINKLLYGVLIGLLLAMLTFGITLFIWETFPSVKRLLYDPRIPFIIAFIPNLLVMRHYFVNLKLEKAGRGILLITFVGVLLVFFLVK